jgi:two-component system, NtrC family, sensor kinase
MGWMLDQTTSALSLPQILFVDAPQSDHGLIEQQAQGLASSFFISSSSKLEDQITQHTKGLFLFVSLKSYPRFKEIGSKLKKNWPNLPLAVVFNDLAAEQVSEMINDCDVFILRTNANQVRDNIQLIFEEEKRRTDLLEGLQVVRRQNEQLEVLNQNLEDLVLQRTSKDYEASQQAEVSLKEIQQILNFLKNISRAATLEDLLYETGNEFKKFQGLRPPILMLYSAESGGRLFYFQGRQLVKKVISSTDVHSLFTHSQSAQNLQHSLSNLLGRPFSSVYKRDVAFKSEDLIHTQALLIFEHSLHDLGLMNLGEFGEERWSIINMALENIILKEGLEDIARQWAKTFNQMSDPILIVDQNYQIALSNSNFHREGDKTCYKVFAGRDKPCVECPMSKTFSSGLPQSSDISLSRKIYRVNSYPIHLAKEGRVSHVINQYADVTATVDLRSQVIQGEKMAAVGLLAGNIAHELNNPLTGISSLSELLLTEIDSNSNTYKDLKEVKDASARCQRIIKDLLDFSSLGSDSKTRKLNLVQIVGKTLPLLKVSMRAINTDISLDDDSLWVEGAPQLLQQVIFNLVNNACQAMQDGDRLSVWVKRQGNQAEIGVRDTGSGIPVELREQIFEPFFTTKENGKGTGLGLSMSRTIIERFGGKLILNQEYTKGTEFLIYLPLVEP